MDLRNRRGGIGRPVFLVRRRWSGLSAAVVAATWLLVATGSQVAAHGGVATLQLGAERVNPGGTVELRGDMTSGGPVEVDLTADADGSRHRLGFVEADAEGHFEAFLLIPSDLPPGTYTVRVHGPADDASAPVVVAGAPVDGEEGELPGQDEPINTVLPIASGHDVLVPAPSGQSPASTQPEAGEGSQMTLLVGALGISVAVALGALARARSRPPVGPPPG